MFDFKNFLTYWDIPLLGKYGLLPMGISLVMIALVYVFVRRQEHKRRNERLWVGYNELMAETAGETDTEDSVSVIPEFENARFVPYVWTPLSDEDTVEQATRFYQKMNQRRTLRSFSSKPVPKKAIEMILRTAGTSPSGAHQQPWTYVVICNQDIKQQVRLIVEKEEEVNYKRRMGTTWVNRLKPFRTNWIKPYITDAPYIILVFKQVYSWNSDGTKRAHYYSEHSVSISVGFLLTAIHNAGLYSLTSTPLNCGPAISALLKRPVNEKLLYLLPVGLPADDCEVPDLKRKGLDDVAIFV